MKINQYIIRYTTKDGDLSSCLVYGHSIDEAIAVARYEYWDIKDIISVIKE